MRLTNNDMYKYICTLSECMETTGLLGYAIARNYRKLLDAAKEYLEAYQKTLEKYGAEDTNGELRLDCKSENFQKFIDEITPLSRIEHNVEIMQVPIKESIGQLSAKQIVDLDFMLSEAS